MKHFRFSTCRQRRRGFSLVEGVFSLGVMSFGLLATAPLLVFGINDAHAARENRATAQIAAALVEQVRQGTVSAAPLYYDSTGQPCAAAQAVYQAQETVQAVPAPEGGSTQLNRLTLRVTPLGLPGAARTYADVFPTAP